jgi:hypothetical protein
MIFRKTGSTFPDHAANKKAPVLFRRGASVQLMRSFDYARTPPKAPEGALVFRVLLVANVMARTYAAGQRRRQPVLG